ncbi:MAG: hypothetical protein EOM01_10840 [Spirochaetia bacterium]|nr:hypothetical protein [Spirochaetia bacterium]
MAVTEKQMEQIANLNKTLLTYRAIYEGHWGEIIKYLAPSYASARPSGEPGSESAPDFKDIFDTSAIYASNILADGLQGYAFGRNIAWFRLRFEEKGLMDGKLNREYLQLVEKHQYDQFDKSNFYDESRAFLRCGADFGTAVMTIEQDNERGIPVFHTLHPGTYAIEENRFGDVSVLVRRFWLTLPEAIEKFGEDNLPKQMLSNKEDVTSTHEFYQYIAPDTRIKVDIAGTDPFVSIYWASAEAKKPVKEERFTRKPFFSWRWAKNPCGSPWGVDNPGMVELPNIKMLQSLKQDQLRLSQLIARPPIKRTEGLRVNFTPSGFTDITPGADFAPVQMVGNLAWTENQIALYRQQVDASYHKDFFLALMSNLERLKTATEVNALVDEKSAIMSSFFSRLSHEFIEPVLEAVYEMEMDAMRLPPPPATLAEQQLRIDFVSPLSMLQKRALTFNTTKQFLAELLAVAELNPTVFDKVNLDRYVEVAGEGYNVDEKIIKSDKEVAEIRAARAAMQQRQLEFENNLRASETGAKSYGAASKAPEKGSPAEAAAKGGRV